MVKWSWAITCCPTSARNFCPYSLRKLFGCISTDVCSQQSTSPTQLSVQPSLVKATMHPAFPHVAPLLLVFGCLVESWATTELKILETEAIAYAAWISYQEIHQTGQAHWAQRLWTALVSLSHPQVFVPQEPQIWHLGTSAPSTALVMLLMYGAGLASPHHSTKPEHSCFQCDIRCELLITVPCFKVCPNSSQENGS